MIELLNVRSEKGIVSAANIVNQPSHNTLAEIKEVSPHENDIPNREHIAERRNGNANSNGNSNAIALSNFFTKPIEIPKVENTILDLPKSYLDVF